MWGRGSRMARSFRHGRPGEPQVSLTFGVSNCPVLFNACNNYRLKPLVLELLPQRD